MKPNNRLTPKDYRQLMNFIIGCVVVALIVLISVKWPEDVPARKLDTTSIPVHYDHNDNGHFGPDWDMPSKSDYAHVATMDSMYNIAVKNHYKTSLIEIPKLISSDSVYQRVLRYQLENHSEIGRLER